MSAYDPDNIFAKILRGEIPCEKVFEDENTVAFMDVMPRADGHVLVLPKAGARNLLDIPQDTLSTLILSVKRSPAPSRRAWRPMKSPSTSSTNRRAARRCSTSISM